MHTKLKHAKAILLLAVVSTPTLAVTPDLPFKMVVMSDNVINKAMMKDSPTTVVNKIKRNKHVKYSYNANMGLCVAYLQAESLDKSVNACSAAINSKELKRLDKQQSNYYKALGYSNRGISKYKGGDISGAYEDLSLASKTNENPIVKANFLLIKEVVEASL